MDDSAPGPEAEAAIRVVTHSNGKVRAWAATEEAPMLAPAAGITHAAQWKARGATVIGEPVGDGLDMWSEGGNLTLPHSELTVHYANAFHRYSTTDYPDRKPYFFQLAVSTLDPDERVEQTWDDYIAGRDVVFEAVARRIMLPEVPLPLTRHILVPE